jgi:HSP20 family protein
MYQSLLNFPGGLFGEFDRLRRQLDEVFDGVGMPTSIRAVAPGAYPALNIGTTPTSIEVYAFAPGLKADKIDVTVDRGVLSITGERAPSEEADKATTYTQERVYGSFRRALSLPEDADPDRISARYQDGLLQVSVARKEAMQPKRIAVN